MGFVDYEHDSAVAFRGFGGEQVGGLGHELGSLVAGFCSEGSDDGDVEASGAEGGVGDVDDLVSGGVQCRYGGSDRHGFSCADVSGDHTEGVLDDAEVDAGDGFLVGGPGVEVGGRDGFAEGGAFEPEVGGPRGGR